MAARLAVIVLLAITLVTLVQAAPASAAGVGVAPRRLDFDNSPGGATKKLYVINTGHEESLYRVYVEGEYRSWFRISPDEFSLYPDQNIQVSITLTPPWTARGEHATDVRVVSLETSSELQIGTGVKVPARVSLSGPAPLLIIGIICAALVLAGTLAGLIWRRTKRPAAKAGQGLALLLLLVPTLVMGGCQGQNPQNPGAHAAVRVVATQDFGRQLMFDQTVELTPGTPAIEALQQVAAVETAYGGGFVNAIDSVRSGFGQGLTRDWFVYFNGIAAGAGALNYGCQDGDVQSWDFHDWAFRMFVPALVGSFPEPFLHGYHGDIRPTVVVYDDGFNAQAAALEAALAGRGVADLSVKHVTELTGDDRSHSNLIIIGTSECSLLAELNAAWDRLGFFVHFEDGVMVAYDVTGNVGATYGPGTGLLQATQNPWNPKGTAACENVAWMVSGTDRSGVEGAVDALVTCPEELRYACAAVIAGGEVVRVPR